MAVDHVKSTPITNLDAVPRVPNTTGQGSGGQLTVNDGFATAVAASSVDATYQLVRIPSDCVVKTLVFESEAQGAGAFDVGLYYSTGGDSPGAATSLLAAAAIDQDFFATVINCASAVVRTDILNESGTYTLDKRNQPIWQAVGLTQDPGGYFDVVATVKTTAVTTGTGKLGVQVGYVV